jgi:hypothetical protein
MIGVDMDQSRRRPRGDHGRMHAPPKPWYREPWPWILMSGPAAVVLAGIATMVLAVTSFDGMVADDYYKEGLAINRVIARESAARSLGLAAAVSFSPDRTRVRVTMAGDPGAATPALSLVHPTLPAEDQSVVLSPRGGGLYEGEMRAPRGVAMRVRLEDGRRWRLSGAWATREDSIRLAP